MSNVAFGWPNRIDTSSLSGGSWGDTLVHLQTRDWSQKARSASAATSATKFIVNQGSTVATRAVALPGWNLSASALLKVSLGSSSGGAEVHAGSWATAYPAGYSATVRRTPCVILPAGLDARYVLVEIDDTSNADGYVEGGRAFVGPLVVPELGAVYGRRQGAVDHSTSVRLESGAKRSFVREKTRTVAMEVRALRRVSEYASVRDMLFGAGVSQEVYYVPNFVPSDANRDGFLGTFTSVGSVTDDHYGYCGTSIEIEEDL